MKKLKEISIYKYLQFVIYLGTFLLMFVWNFITPLWNDDEFWIGMSPKDIWQNGIHDYFYQNSRFIGQLIARTLANLPQFFEALLESIAFILLIWLIVRLSTQREETPQTHFVKFLFVVLGIFLFTPGFSNVYLWRPGAGNYLWLMLIDLAYIYLFLRLRARTSELILLCIVGFIAGTTNENTVGGIIIITLMYWLCGRVDRPKILAIIFNIGGYLILLLGPGDHVRAKNTNPQFLKLSFFGKIETNITDVNNFVMNNLMWLIVVFIVLFSISLLVYQSFEFHRNAYDSLIWFIAAILTWYVLLLSPGSPSEPQSYFGGFILMLISCSKLIRWTSVKQGSFVNAIMLSLMLLLTFFTFISVSNGFVDSYRTDKAIAQRNSTIISAKKQGKKTCAVSPLSYYGKSKYSMFYWQFDISKDPSAWPNQAVAHHFGIEKVWLR